jgi:cytochrome c biogenesis protein CcdA
MLGWLGDWVADRMLFYFVSPLALLLAARELGFVRFRLPERKRQTEKLWANEFGFVTASVMWGFHLGFGFATRITYGGFWVLVMVAFAVGDPRYGASLMLMYWVGRVMPVWVAPAFLSPGQTDMELSDMIFADRDSLNGLVGIALLWSAGIAMLLAIAGGGTSEALVERLL